MLRSHTVKSPEKGLCIAKVQKGVFPPAQSALTSGRISWSSTAVHTAMETENKMLLMNEIPMVDVQEFGLTKVSICKMSELAAQRAWAMYID